MQTSEEGGARVNGPADTPTALALSIARADLPVIGRHAGGRGVCASAGLANPAGCTLTLAAHAGSVPAAEDASLIPGTGPVVALAVSSVDRAQLVGVAGAQATCAYSTFTADRSGGLGSTKFFTDYIFTFSITFALAPVMSGVAATFPAHQTALP